MHKAPNIGRGAAMRPQRRPDGVDDCRLALAIAAAAFDVPPVEISAPKRRGADVAAARHVAIYLAHIVFQASMQSVAEAFGRDRTSVAHAVHRVEDRRDDPAFDRLMERLEELAAFCRARHGSARTAGIPS